MLPDLPQSPCGACTPGEQERLLALHQLELLDTRPEACFDRLAQFASNLFGTPIALISLIDSNRQWCKSRHGVDLRETPRDVAFCDHAIRDHGVYVVQDATRHPLFRKNPLVTGEPHVRFYAGAPLVRRCQNIGVICVIDRRPRKFSQRDSELLRELAVIVMMEAENRLAKRRLVRRLVSVQLARRSADAANKSKTEYLSQISHELRTPMHAILNNANIGRNKTPEGGSQNTDKYFVNIQSAGKRLLGLLNDLLDLEKMEAGKVNYTFARADLAEAFKAAESELAPLISLKHLAVALVIEAQDSGAVFDRASIIQVMINLLSNAIKYSPEGGVIGVTISDAASLCGKPALQFSIADQGPGIAEGELETIFDKYTKCCRKQTSIGGTGLGLSICRKIIQAHQGVIWAGNRDTGGALITFVLPR